ncbi:MAG: hypothetical protein MUE36_02230 [Acidimicrobiales bacterium]|jgi:hypothetical protein|nr:hypothetical protein [Acidimicrobiales bacterium]
MSRHDTIAVRRGTNRRRSRWTAPAALALGLVLLAGACTDDESTAPEVPATTLVPADVDVTGPITGGIRDVVYVPMPPGLDEEFGYVEEEYFVTGDAPSYEPTAPLTEDGRWTLTEGPEAPYASRVVVRRPVDPADFNGTVVVEWLNVSAGRESDPDFGFLHPYLMREGYAYVSVSAQAGGIMGGGAILEVPGVDPEALLPAKEWDPERYAPLDVPPDEHSYGIFTDAAELVRAPGPVDPLGGLRPDEVIAVGQSQSASRLVAYANGVQPLTDAFDGFLIHSRSDSSAGFGEEPTDDPPDVVAIRDDLGVPVVVVQSETEAIRSNIPAGGPPDTADVRIWQVAGTAHADQSTLDHGRASGSRWTTSTYDPTPYCGRVNDGPMTPVVRGAMAALRGWVVDGTPAATAPRIEVAEGAIVRDADGNALGGVRTPAVDAPVSTLTGEGNPSSIFCILFGQEMPFSAERLAALYPDDAAYVARVTASADAAVAAGFMLPEERDAIVTEAEADGVPTG